MHFLSEETFVQGLTRICHASSEEKDSIMFDLLDEDSSGYISLPEFRGFLRAFFGAAKDAYERNAATASLGHTPTVLDSLCALLPIAEVEEFAEQVQARLHQQVLDYTEAVVATAYKEQDGGREARMYLDDFQEWTAGE